MKRVFACVLMAVMWLVPFAFSEEIDPMQAVEDLLDVDLILLEKKSVSVNRIYYDYDENEMFSVFHFAGEDADGRVLFVSEDSEGNVEILSDVGCAGFDTWTMKTYVMGFIMDEYEENLLQMKQNFFADVRLNEKFFSEEEADGMRIITTKTHYQGDFSGGCDVMEYVVDIESGELIEIYEYFEDETGARTLNSKSYVTMGTQYDIRSDLAALFETEDTREVFVHLPEGEVIRFEPPADTDFTIIYPEEYVLYEDEAKTRMYAGQEADEDGNYPKETHLYLDVFG